MLNVVLIEPEIPNNTGNIGRLCVGMGARLHLVHPLGFKITDTSVKRAGLDYWPHLDLVEHESVENWLSTIEDSDRVHLMSSHAEALYYECTFRENDFLVFGKESVGLSLDILAKFDSRLRIPISSNVRSYNVANSVAIVLSEANRQIAFKALP